MRQKRIRYGIDKETGYIISQKYGEGIAMPVIDFKNMKPQNNFKIKTNLEKFDIYSLINMDILFTRKIPIELKNKHRKFWNMKPLILNKG